jgi:DNA (cytosine-5)-methyltransferase 1
MFKDKYYKLKDDDVCKTICAHMKLDCNMYIHPNQARGLTPREAARIQSFPDNYVFRGTPGEWYRQIGNAVPPVLAYSIASAVKEYI